MTLSNASRPQKSRDPAGLQVGLQPNPRTGGRNTGLQMESEKFHMRAVKCVRV